VVQEPALELVMAGRPRGRRNSALCLDCAVDVVATGQWCLLKDAIWAQAA
jgi:hypothetical protein